MGWEFKEREGERVRVHSLEKYGGIGGYRFTERVI